MPIDLPAFTTRPEIRGSFGAVATTHWIASAAGMAVLERGGNAFDAAAAAAFTLQIVEPHLNGPGGDAPILALRAGSPQPVVICGQGPMPMAATIAHFAGLGLRQIPGSGLLPAVVPGAFDAWMLLLRDFGTWHAADVLAYAIDYAEAGYPVLPRVAATIEACRPMFQTEWPSSAAAWLDHGAVPTGTWRNPAIAATYRRILAEAAAAGPDRERQIDAARDTFYRGFVAEAIDRFCRTASVMDDSGSRHAGLLRAADMAAFAARQEASTWRDYHGWTIHKTGPWGQGPALLEALSLLEGFDLGAMDPNGDDFVHTVVECMKLAYADRDTFFGDPDFIEIPLETLLSPAYAAIRRQSITGMASQVLVPSHLPHAAARLEHLRALCDGEMPVGAGTGEPTFSPAMKLPKAEGGDTVHLDVVDRWGNMVAATPSGGWLQSSPTIPELGFCLPTRGQMCWLEPGHPASLRPGARPRTTLTPTLVTRDGEGYLAFGTPGGDQQDQWTLTLLLRLIHHGMAPQQAIDQPLFTSKHLISSFYPRRAEPGVLLIESRFSAETLAALERRGHRLSLEGPWSLGRLCAAGRANGQIFAAATPRLMQAYAIGR
jgi:gamma-glutamyltranspeptidase/glutathione hydrolase